MGNNEGAAVKATSFDNENNKKPIAILKGGFDPEEYDAVLIPEDSMMMKSHPTEKLIPAYEIFDPDISDTETRERAPKVTVAEEIIDTH